MRYEKKIVKDFMDADRLMRNGFICLGVDKNKFDNGKIIFWFKNTYELNQALESYKNERINKQV